VLAGLRAAKSIGITTVGFTGTRRSPMIELCDICVAAPSEETPIIQQIHIMAGHIICGLVERATIAAKADR
jgi:D-sedoheptulose 7-phosphate isomerase